MKAHGWRPVRLLLLLLLLLLLQARHRREKTGELRRQRAHIQCAPARLRRSRRATLLKSHQMGRLLVGAAESSEGRRDGRGEGRMSLCIRAPPASARNAPFNNTVVPARTLNSPASSAEKSYKILNDVAMKEKTLKEIRFLIQYKVETAPRLRPEGLRP